MIEHGGTEVRTEGDAFFCAFSNPSQALAACLEAQRALCAYPWPDGAELRTRMGLHTGEAEPVEDDYVALSVHQAARVCDAGHGGQVVVSEATRLFLGERLPPETSLRPLGQYRLKDFPDPTTLYQLRHPELPAEFPALRALPATAHNVPEQATLFVGRRHLVVGVQKLQRFFLQRIQRLVFLLCGSVLLAAFFLKLNLRRLQHALSQPTRMLQLLLDILLDAIVFAGGPSLLK